MSSLATARQQPEDDSTNKLICRLCKRQFAKYTCPTCNAPYCSLTCFRSPSHSQCSETFYKNELESDITTTPSRTAEERKQMMELLKRFEDDAAADEDLLNKEVFASDGEASDAEALATRLAGVDIDSLSSEDMWHILTPAEKKKFTNALENPNSELAQNLLNSESLQVELEQPWWTQEDEERVQAETRNGDRYRKRGTQSKPEPIHIPESMVTTFPRGHSLLYNICAVCIAYSYAIRNLGIRMLSTLSPTNPDRGEALQLIGQLTPFLLDRGSTILHTGVGAVVTDVYSRFEMGKANSELLAVLLEDTSMLMKPVRILTLSSSTSVPSQSVPAGIPEKAGIDASVHPHVVPILVLSDLVWFFRFDEHQAQVRSEGLPEFAPELKNKGSMPGQPRNTQLEKLSPGSKLGRTHGLQHVVRKLEFYIAHVVATPSSLLEEVAEEVLHWSEKIKAEGRSVVDREKIMERPECLGGSGLSKKLAN